MSESVFFLKNNCFVCKVGNHWIVLNAESDRYLAITDADLAAIAHRVHGCQDLSTERGMPHRNNAEPPLIISLVASGVLTIHAFEGKPFQHEIIIACTTGIDTTTPPPRSRVPLVHLCKFVLACTKTDWRLRRHSFLQTIDHVQRRQLVLQQNKRYQLHAVAPLIAQFRSLRPLYPRPSVCLFDSLALLDFLARYKVYANLVFGVVADPFTAHCWVQQDDVVLNDDIESLRRYTPILGL